MAAVGNIQKILSDIFYPNKKDPIAEYKSEHYVDIPALPKHLADNLLDEMKTGSVVVTILGDDQTPMLFVGQLLDQYFQFDFHESCLITMEVHTQGRSQLLRANPDVAESISKLVSKAASKYGYSLKCEIEAATFDHDIRRYGVR